VGVDLREMGRRAVQGGRQLGLLPTAARNRILDAIADRLEVGASELTAANEADLAEGRANNLAPSLLDRLALTQERLVGMAQGCRDVAALPDPLGEEFDVRRLANGMRVARRRVPLGVLAVIFESRPNVTVDISALCIKTGNGAILRGGKESLRSNMALIKLVHEACEEAGASADAVQLIESTDRALVPELLSMDDVVDLVVPRGGPGLQALVREHATMPVVYGGIGVCHLYVDRSADLARSLPVINNAKTQAPSVCNALDTVLVHEKVAADFVPAMVRDLVGDGVRVLVDEPSLATLMDTGLADHALVGRADDGSYGHEFLGLTLSVKVVPGLDDALAHIAQYGTGHSDGILTNDYDHATRFLNEVNSAAVYVNASTRFTDGGQFGLGAEVAISTQKLHARGPMGLRELTTYKWVVEGDYTVRA
jgi:glutamate-5-semialdehyde dehydrogenase